MRNGFEEWHKPVSYTHLDVYKRQAYKYLPIAHRDFLVPNINDRAYAGARYWGRFDGITTRAIKAQVYLTWASPRFNPGNDLTRWDMAAKNAKEVMDFKTTKDAVSKGFTKTKGVNWFDPNFPGIVFSSVSYTHLWHRPVRAGQTTRLLFSAICGVRKPELRKAVGQPRLAGRRDVLSG